MKKIWEKPQVKNLGIESTMSDDDIMILSARGLFGWKCPCCGDESGYIYNTSDEANERLEAHKSLEHPYGCSVS